MLIRRWITRVYNKMHWFSDADAWLIFRIAAFSECATWAMLIFAIVWRNYGWTGGEIAVSIAGTVHGTMLLVYFTLVTVLSRSMEWGFGRVAAGYVAGNIPFATVVLERWLARYRLLHPVRIAAPAGYMED